MIYQNICHLVPFIYTRLGRINIFSVLTYPVLMMLQCYIYVAEVVMTMLPDLSP